MNPAPAKEPSLLEPVPECLAISPAQITHDQIACARLLPHIDGRTIRPLLEHAAQHRLRAENIPVTVDVDTIYAGFDRVLPLVDYLISSAEFPARWTGYRRSMRRTSIAIQQQSGMRVAAMTLGAHGALAYSEGRFHYSPAFVVNCVDTTACGRRVPRGLLLFCGLAENVAHCRCARIFQCNGRVELHRTRGEGSHR